MEDELDIITIDPVDLAENPAQDALVDSQPPADTAPKADAPDAQQDANKGQRRHSATHEPQGAGGKKRQRNLGVHIGCGPQNHCRKGIGLTDQGGVVHDYSAANSYTVQKPDVSPANATRAARAFVAGYRPIRAVAIFPTTPQDGSQGLLRRNGGCRTCQQPRADGLLLPEEWPRQQTR